MTCPMMVVHVSSIQVCELFVMFGIGRVGLVHVGS